MGTYTATAGNDRAKALAGVVLVHVVLGAIILTGLNVHNVRQVVESLKTFDVTEKLAPPPPPPPPPREKAERAKNEEGAAGKKAEPTPVVAPTPKIVVPAKPPVVAAPVAGTGNAARSGAANAGLGPGAGGQGSGRGGGGTGDFTGFTPARLVRNLNRRDYRDLTGGRLPYGRAMVALQLSDTGVPTSCRIARSSGDPFVDAGLCPLIYRRLRFLPARDAAGRAITYSLNYIADWSL